MTMPSKIWAWEGGKFWEGESHKLWSMSDAGPDMDGAFGGEGYIRADLAEELARALETVKTLNMTAPDDNGQQWAISDLIDQEVMFALARFNETKGE